MHSSRMLTAHFNGHLYGGGCLPMVSVCPEGCLPKQGVSGVCAQVLSALRCVSRGCPKRYLPIGVSVPRVCTPPWTQRQTPPCERNDRQVSKHYLPATSSAGGNKIKSRYLLLQFEHHVCYLSRPNDFCKRPEEVICQMDLQIVFF